LFGVCSTWFGNPRPPVTRPLVRAALVLVLGLRAVVSVDGCLAPSLGLASKGLGVSPPPLAEPVPPCGLARVARVGPGGAANNGTELRVVPRHRCLATFATEGEVGIKHGIMA